MKWTIAVEETVPGIPTGVPVFLLGLRDPLKYRGRRRENGCRK